MSSDYEDDLLNAVAFWRNKLERFAVQAARHSLLKEKSEKILKEINSYKEDLASIRGTK